MKIESLSALSSLAIAIFLITSSNAAASSKPSAPLCSKSGYNCSVYAFVAASEEILKTNGRELVVSCPQHVFTPPTERIMSECIRLIEASVTIVNGHFIHSLVPIDASAIKYQSVGSCTDTVVSNCYSQIDATIALNWVVVESYK